MGRTKGHETSAETRKKIGDAVRRAAKRRHEREQQEQDGPSWQKPVRERQDALIEPAKRLAEAANGHERFPFEQYGLVLHEAEQLVYDRDQRGRNLRVPFYDGFPHGVTDVTFELHRRVARVLGAEDKIRNGHDGAFNDPNAREDVRTMRGDLMDLVNYAAFAVMLLDKAAEQA